MALFSPDLPYELHLEIWLYLDDDILEVLLKLPLTETSMVKMILDDPTAWVTRATRNIGLPSNQFWARSPVEAALPLLGKTQAQKACHRYIELVSRTGLTFGSSYFLDDREILDRALVSNNLPLARQLLPVLYPHLLAVNRFRYYMWTVTIPNRDIISLFQEVCPESCNPDDYRYQRAGKEGQLLIEPFEITQDYVFCLTASGHIDILNQYIATNQASYHAPNGLMKGQIFNGTLVYGNSQFYLSLPQIPYELYLDSAFLNHLPKTKNPRIITAILQLIPSHHHERFINQLAQECLNQGAVSQLRAFLTLLQFKPTITNFNNICLALAGYNGLELAQWLSENFSIEDITTLRGWRGNIITEYAHRAVKEWLLN